MTNKRQNEHPVIAIRTKEIILGVVCIFVVIIAVAYSVLHLKDKRLPVDNSILSTGVMPVVSNETGQQVQNNTSYEAPKVGVDNEETNIDITQDIAPQE